MTRYTHADWQRLGRAVYSARMADGFTDTQEWCEIVGRSDRMLLGLERGERVGKGTLKLIEDALDWPTGRAFAILAGDHAEPSPRTPASVRDATDEQLLDELRRRLRAGQDRREGTDDGASMTTSTARVVANDKQGITVEPGATAPPPQPRRVTKKADRHTSGP